MRRGRGYRDLNYLLIKLSFMIVYPICNERGVARFIAFPGCGEEPIFTAWRRNH